MHDETAITGAFRGRPLRRLLELVWLERRLLGIACIYLLLVTGMDLVFPHALKVLVDAALIPAAQGSAGVSLWEIAGALAAVSVVRFAAQFRYARYGQLLSFNVMHRLREALFRHVPRLQVVYFDRTPSGRLMTRLTSDVNAVQDFLATGLLTLTRDLLILGGSLFMLWTLSERIAIAQLSLVLVLIAVSQIFGRFVRIQLREVTRLAAALNARMKDVVGVFTSIRAYGAEGRFASALESVNQSELRASLSGVRWSGIYQPIMAAGGYLGIGVALVLGAPRVASGELSLGSLLAAIAYSELLFGPVRDIADKYLLLVSSLASAEKVYEVLDQPAEIMNGTPSAALIDPFPITVTDLRFSYDGKVSALKGVSFEVTPGKCMAILGPTGSGKSSILQVLVGFYDQYTGMISAGGVDLRSVSLADRRALFCYVSQLTGEPHEPLRELLSGQEELRLWSLAKGTRGPLEWRSLSSGQRQLLGLLSALRKPAPVLLLDEATAAMDHVLSEAVLAYIRERRRDSATMIITHRPSEVTGCDEIILLSEGEVLERGDHKGLISRESTYAKLLRAEEQGEIF